MIVIGVMESGWAIHSSKNREEAHEQLPGPENAVYPLRILVVKSPVDCCCLAESTRAVVAKPQLYEVYCGLTKLQRNSYRIQQSDKSGHH